MGSILKYLKVYLGTQSIVGESRCPTYRFRIRLKFYIQIYVHLNTVLTLKWRVHVKQFNTENPHHSQNVRQKMREGTKLGYK